MFHNIYQYLGCTKPFRRLWLTSLTDEAVRAGLNDLRDGGEFDGLCLAAATRAKVDWLVGINASRTLQAVAGVPNISLGRVQTPVLAMVCRRFVENRHPEAKPYRKPYLTVVKDGVRYRFACDGSFTERVAAESAYACLQKQPAAQVVSVERRTVKQSPPPLYDLTSLQMDAITRYGLTASQTLAVARRLYEAGLISHPSSGTIVTTGGSLGGLGESGKVDNFKYSGRLDATGASGKSDPSGESEGLHNPGKHDKSGDLGDPVKRSKHDGLDNIGGHGRPDATGNLGEHEQAVYSLIAVRERETASPDCRKKSVRVRVVCGGMSFALRQVHVVNPGWREVLNRATDAEQDEVGYGSVGDENAGDGNGSGSNGSDAKHGCSDVKLPIPAFVAEELLPVAGCNLAELKPHPKPLYTKATLLEAMANVGQALPEVALAEAEAPSQAEWTKDATHADTESAAAAASATALFDAMPGNAQLDTPVSSATAVPPQPVQSIPSEVGAPSQVAETESAVPTTAASGNDRIHTYGIGAPSPPASVIETLIAREYVEHESESEGAAAGLIPTERGLHLWKAVHTMLIADIGMTIHWERQLALIGSGELTADAFHGEIAAHVRRMTAEILAISTPDGAWGCFPCPKCKTGKVILRPRSARCNNPACGLAIYRTIRGVRLTDSHVGQLLTSGNTDIIDGFAGAKGRKFSAPIVLDEKYNLRFEYPEAEKRRKK
ncbi:hypothetical protein FACS1894159_06770 [Bacteroidia bacterium]|nr:hypothetical protein FACS1894159_06770 [Bacteroidia bacterium]